MAWYLDAGGNGFGVYICEVFLQSKFSSALTAPNLHWCVELVYCCHIFLLLSFIEAAVWVAVALETEDPISPPCYSFDERRPRSRAPGFDARSREIFASLAATSRSLRVLHIHV